MERLHEHISFFFPPCVNKASQVIGRSLPISIPSSLLHERGRVQRFYGGRQHMVNEEGEHRRVRRSDVQTTDV